MDPSASIYDKLNNVHASLRKQKEDAYRTKQLAEERLRLARVDREALEKKQQETKVQLRMLKEKAVGMKGANGGVEGSNRQMEKEFNFQHSELQGKREKLSRLEDKRNSEANSRNHSVSLAREMLRRLREDSSKNGPTTAYSNLSTEEKRRELEQIMESSGGQEEMKNLPELVKITKTQKEEEVGNLETRNASLRRIIGGYQNALGSVSIMGQPAGGNPVMQQ